MKITILSLFRDSEKTIKNCLKQLDELEKNTNADFEYFFYDYKIRYEQNHVLCPHHAQHVP